MTNSTNILNQIRNKQYSSSNNKLAKMRNELTRRDFVEQQLELYENLDSYPPEPEKVTPIADQYVSTYDKWGNLTIGPSVGQQQIDEFWEEYVKGRGKKIPYEEERSTIIRSKDDDIRRQPLVIADYFFDKADRIGKIRGTHQQDEIIEIMEGKKPIPKGIKQKHIDNAHKIAQLYPEIWLTTNLAKGKISPFRRDMVSLCDAFPSMDTFTKLSVIGLSKLPRWYHLWDKPVYDAHDNIQHLKTLKHGFNNTTCTLKYVNQSQLQTSNNRLTRFHFHTEYNELIELELGGELNLLARMLNSSFKGKTFKVVNPTIIKHDRQVPFVSVIGKITNFEDFYPLDLSKKY
jgi:hypothetical protein